MNWSDFIEKIRTYKKAYVNDLSINAGALNSLLYAGAFDSMIGGKPTFQDYARLSGELIEALGSKAKPAKAKKGELLGIADIDNDIKLNIWRNQANPLQSFSFIDKLKGTLKDLGFTERSGSVLAPYFHKKEEAYLISDWDKVFDEPWARDSMVGRYDPEQGKDKWNVAIVGLVSDVEIRKTKKGKEFLSFTLQMDSGKTGSIKAWGNESGFVDYHHRSSIKDDELIIAIVKLDDSWNNIRQGTLQNFKVIKWK